LVVMPCSGVVGYLLHHYTMLQPRRPWLDCHENFISHFTILFQWNFSPSTLSEA